MTARDTIEAEKRLVAEAAAELVEPGMRVGLGTGSTVAHLLPALARRNLPGLRCIATSDATTEQASALGLPVEPFDALERLDITIDGADQVDATGWIVKGGGGAHLREKIAAHAAERFVVMVSSDKVVDRLSGPVPLELFAFGLPATLHDLGGVRLRDAPPSPDGNFIGDLHVDMGDPAALAAALDAAAGVAGHGLFDPSPSTTVLVARGGRVASHPAA